MPMLRCWQRQQLAAGGIQHAARTPLLECSPGLAVELSKLSTVQTYPEFARALLESAPVGFNIAVSVWEKRHGKVQGHLGYLAHVADFSP